MHRRAFLKAAVAALAVAALPLGQAAPSALLVPPIVRDRWTYNVELGCFQNEALSSAVRLAAAKRPKPWKMKASKEYGRAWHTTGPLADLSNAQFSELTEFARKTHGRYGEVRAAIPTDFGRQRMIAWYVPRTA